MTPGMTIPILNSTLMPASAPATSQAKPDDPAKVRDAAQQFEALLLSQILRSVRESCQREKSDQSGECATDFAEQQFARVLAQQGGLGLASLIARGLTRPPAANGDSVEQYTKDAPREIEKHGIRRRWTPMNTDWRSTIR